jgi:hypothetical protein
VQFNWDEPLKNNGSIVLSYRIKFKNKAGTFVEDLTNCDGINSTIKTNRQCSVAMTVFESTHLLVLHDKIIAVVEAKNLIGFSTPSAENVLGPVLLQTVPHKPPTPPTNGANTSHLQLHVEWNAL